MTKSKMKFIAINEFGVDTDEFIELGNFDTKFLKTYNLAEINNIFDIYYS